MVIKCINCYKKIKKDLYTCDHCCMIFYCSLECKSIFSAQHDIICHDVLIHSKLHSSSSFSCLSTVTLDHAVLQHEKNQNYFKAKIKEHEDPSFSLLNIPIINCWDDYLSYNKSLNSSFILPNTPLYDIISQKKWLLTTYNILCHFIKNNNEEISRKFTIHILGVTQEIYMRKHFRELSSFFPGIHFTLYFIGDQMLTIEDEGLNNDTVLIIAKVGLYHLLNLPPPQLAIAFNAGLPAYRSWIPTVLLLKKHKTPTYITDYCWSSYHLTKKSISFLSCHENNKAEGSSHAQSESFEYSNNDAFIEREESKNRIGVSDGWVNAFHGSALQHETSLIEQFSNHIIFQLEY